MLGSNSSFSFFKQINYFVIQIRQELYGPLHKSGRRFWVKLCDKERNWMTMFQNWSTQDEIETSIRTFQSVRDEIENTFFLIEWRGDENGREYIIFKFSLSDGCSITNRFSPFILMYWNNWHHIFPLLVQIMFQNLCVVYFHPLGLEWSYNTCQHSIHNLCPEHNWNDSCIQVSTVCKLQAKQHKFWHLFSPNDK